MRRGPENLSLFVQKKNLFVSMQYSSLKCILSKIYIVSIIQFLQKKSNQSRGPSYRVFLLVPPQLVLGTSPSLFNQCLISEKRMELVPPNRKKMAKVHWSHRNQLWQCQFFGNIWSRPPNISILHCIVALASCERLRIRMQKQESTTN